MYKKLEESVTVETAASETANEAPEGVCNCPCGSEARNDAEETPAANTTALSLSVYWDVNGK